MKAQFSIETDTRLSLVRIRMAGFFTLQDIGRFLGARRAAHAALTCAPNTHLTLNDVRRMTGQPQSIVDAFQKLLDDPANRSRRLAFVVAPTLARAQLFRALDGRNAKSFNDPVAAEEWLLADDREPQLARTPGRLDIDVRDRPIADVRNGGVSSPDARFQAWCSPDGSGEPQT